MMVFLFLTGGFRHRVLKLNPPVKNKKNIITQKLLVTQSSYIVHCNQHTQKPACADFQAFLNTFFLLKLMGFFFNFLSGEVKQTAKISH